MARVSLKEAYDNKDVVTQIFGLRDEVDKHSEILENLPDPDLTNCVLKTGDQTIAGEKTFTDKIHAEGGLELDTDAGFEVNGTLTVNGDIVQNGEAYETHAEQVFSQNDLIVTRDGAVSALPAGVVSGIQIKKYDGVNDARLAVDNAGVARVGDVGDEQPLMTRAEVADMVGGSFLKWDSQHARAVSGTLDDTPTAGSSNGVKSSGIKNAIENAVGEAEDTLENMIAGKVSGTGDIGDNAHPVKVVNGEAVAIADALQKQVAIQENSGQVTLTNAHPVFNITSITVAKTGTAIITIRGGFDNNANGYRLVGYSKNNAGAQTEWLLNLNSNSDYLYYSTSFSLDVTAGDVIRVCAYQTSGSSLGFRADMRIHIL